MTEDTKGKEKEQSAEPVPDEEQVRVHIDIPAELRVAKYANRVVISRTPGEFVITFAQIPPLRDEVEVEDVRKAGRLDATAVANVVVGHEFLPRIIATFQENLDRFREAQSKKEEGD